MFRRKSSILATMLLLSSATVAVAESPPRYLLKWGQQGSGAGQFHDPVSLTVGGDGVVYVADATNHRVQKFDDKGVFLGAWGSRGTRPGQFLYAYAVAEDAQGNVYVSDNYNHRVQKFTNSGTFLQQWEAWAEPRGVAVDPSGNVYVAEFLTSQVEKFDSNGRLLATWPQYNKERDLNGPSGIAVSERGEVYVVQLGSILSMGEHVFKFSSTGRLLTKWGTTGSGDGQFDCPSEVALDGSGNVYVVDGCNHRVQKFDSNGRFLEKWGSVGDAEGQFLYPRGVAVDRHLGYIYVADTGNQRIQKFGYVTAIQPTSWSNVKTLYR